jgi:putative acetyltransferase
MVLSGDGIGASGIGRVCFSAAMPWCSCCGHPAWFRDSEFYYFRLYMDTYKIIDYEDRYQPAFRALNLVWLDRYNLTEPRDLEVLNDPRKTILEHGGYICLASHGAEIVGSAALMKEHDGIYELAKMTVAEQHQQKGISKLLLEKCLDKAKALKARKVILFSNHQLQAALGLYEKYGFRHVPVEDSPFLTADIKMELVF